MTSHDAQCPTPRGPVARRPQRGCQPHPRRALTQPAPRRAQLCTCQRRTRWPNDLLALRRSRARRPHRATSCRHKNPVFGTRLPALEQVSDNAVFLPVRNFNMWVSAAQLVGPNSLTAQWCYPVNRADARKRCKHGKKALALQRRSACHNPSDQFLLHFRAVLPA